MRVSSPKAVEGGLTCGHFELGVDGQPAANRKPIGDPWSGGRGFSRPTTVSAGLSSSSYFCPKYFLAVATFMYSRRSWPPVDLNP